MADKITLLPCPFCGGEARFERTGVADYFRDSVITCDNCDIYFALDALDATDEDTAATWNMRYDERLRAGIEKALTPQEPVRAEDEHTEMGLRFAECGNCHNAIRRPWAYCPFCGKAVRWDG